MADRRMFSMKIIDSDSFLDMPLSAQSLYFHLAMRADDDGFLNNAKKIMKIIGASQDDYDRLVTERFILLFDDGICVIKHWRMHNYIRSDRYKGTQYTEEKARLFLKENGAYTFNKEKAVTILPANGKPIATQMDTDGTPNDNQLPTVGIPSETHKSTIGTPSGDKRVTQVRLGKDSIGKNSIIKYICPEPGEPAPDCSDIFLPLVDSTFYNVPNVKIQNWSKAFPAVDVEHELRKMITWLDSNPKKQKTPRGINRFINGWLSRTQDNGGSSQSHDDNNPWPEKRFGRNMQ